MDKYERHYQRIHKKWMKMKQKVRNCPNCGSCRTGLNERIGIRKWKKYFIECENCYWCGKNYRTMRMAIWMWNREMRE